MSISHLARVLLFSSLLAMPWSEARAQLGLVQDINAQRDTLTLSGNPRSMTELGGGAFALVSATREGPRLWHVDSVSGATRMIPGFDPSDERSAPNRLVPFGGSLIFDAWDFERGRELWIVESGRARFLHDIRPGALSANPDHFVEYGGALFFTTLGSGANTWQLWRLDGRTTALSLVGSFAGVRDQVGLSSTGAALVFAAPDAQGMTLYVSDGSASGTRVLAGASARVQAPRNFARLGQRVFFAASDGTHGHELWVSDGTPSGTRMVRDLWSGAKSSSPADLTPLGGALWFAAEDGAAGRELWRSDGTSAGTQRFDLWPGVASSAPTQLTALGSQLWFSAQDASAGSEPWLASDTVAPRRVADYVPGPSGSAPTSFRSLGNEVVFTATMPALTPRLVISSGTSQSTRTLSQIDAGVEKLVVGATLYFDGDARAGLGRELYGTTNAGKATLVADLHRYRSGETLSSTPRDVRAIGEHVFFAADDGVHGSEPWVSDGSAAGTRMLADLNVGAAPSKPHGFARSANGVVFAASSATQGEELWRFANGSATLLGDLMPGLASSQPRSFVSMGGRVFFFAGGPSKARWLYVSDGTVAGTLLVTPSFAERMVRMRDALYWSGRDGLDRDGLWRSDGSKGGTVRVSTTPGSGLTVVGDRVFMAGVTPASGRELWVSDGQSASLVTEIVPGAGGSDPERLTAVGDLLYFRARDASNAYALWRSDGTAAGTKRLRSGFVRDLLAVGDECWFRLGDAIWKSDGSSAGTLRVGAASGIPLARLGERVLAWTQDELFAIDRRTGASNPMLGPGMSRLQRGDERLRRSEVALAGASCFVSAQSGVAGVELHALRDVAFAKLIGTSCAGPGRNPRIDASDPRLGAAWTIAGSGFSVQQPALTFVGAPSVLPLFLPGGCDLYVEPASYLPVAVHDRAKWSFTWALPRDGSLIGVTIAVQSLQLAGDRPLGVDLSSALHATLGN